MTTTMCVCGYVDPLRKELCKKTANYSVGDKYDMNKKYVCKEHLDDMVDLHFSLKHTIRIKHL